MAGLTLWLLRHAKVPTATGLCYGRLDLPADGNATHTAAAAFDSTLPPLVTPAWCSPLGRCHQMAHALRHPHLQWQGEDARLAEMDFGDWEGRRWADLSEAEFAPWMADFAHHRVGGTGESVTTVLARVRDALRETFTFCVRHGHTQALWVSHAGVARALVVLLEQAGHVATAADWPREAPEPGAWRCFRVPAASAAAPPA